MPRPVSFIRKLKRIPSKRPPKIVWIAMWRSAGVIQDHPHTAVAKTMVKVSDFRSETSAIRLKIIE